MAQTDETLDMDEEMNGMLLEEQVDPVSGNTAPVGAMPSEVRDDIEINVSPNEFVIPSYAVRYFGEGFFDELLGAAEQGWERIKKGEEPMPPESDSSPEELKEGYADGGGTPSEEAAVPESVGGGYGQYGGTGSRFSGFSYKTFINAETGQEIRVYFFNGKPLSRIPEGYREKGATAVEEQAQITAEATNNTDNGDTVSMAAPGTAEPTYRNTPVEEWTADMYSNYAKYNQSNTNAGDLNIIESTILGLVGGLIGGPAGALGLQGLARKANKNMAEEVVENVMGYVKSSTNPDGSSLDASTLGILNSARVNANYNIMNIDNKNIFGLNKDFFGLDKNASGSILSGTPAATSILEQQRTVTDTILRIDPNKESNFWDDTYDGGVGSFYGGDEETEFDFIGSDDFDWDEWESDTTVGTNVSNVGFGKEVTGTLKVTPEIKEALTTFANTPAVVKQSDTGNNDAHEEMMARAQAAATPTRADRPKARTTYVSKGGGGGK